MNDKAANGNGHSFFPSDVNFLVSNHLIHIQCSIKNFKVYTQQQFHVQILIHKGLYGQIISSYKENGMIWKQT